ncbi:MAG: ribonuclease R [Deltaproteobacteria bacterium]|nr:ribonuclease R [Deltaproteobacteria bacterium]
MSVFAYTSLSSLRRQGSSLFQLFWIPASAGMTKRNRIFCFALARIRLTLKMNKIVGELSLHYEGYGFVIPKEPGHPDVFIPARLVGDAMHGDIVEVSVRQSDKSLFEGAVEKILERRLKQLVGRLEMEGKYWSLITEDQRVHHRMRLKNVDRSLHRGDYVVAKIIKYPQGKSGLEGEVIERLPQRGSLPAEIEYVIAKHQWPKTFPDAVLEEAGSFRNTSEQSEREGEAPAALPAEGATRAPIIDLRSLGFVTIDGEDAKDFDDAVYAEPLSGGDIKLWVAIADVSYYIKPNQPLDREAYDRGTSVYFPGRVLPMLPEVLSNGLCSLRPHEDRLAMVAEMVIDKNGNVHSEHFYSAIFQSKARLTYTLVRRLLVDREEKLREEMDSLLSMLETLSEAATHLKTNRTKRGTIDFDLPEPDIVLDLTGGIENIERAERNWSHQIIEELMIVANESVARFLTKRKVGCVYRVHDSPPPDKLRRFYQLVNRLGYKGKMKIPSSSKILGEVANFFKGHPEIRLVNTMLLRSMSQAVYSHENVGHFGLASECYCHFTSPIRRYPDLIIHRLLKQALRPDTKKIKMGVLAEIAEHCSIQERRAMDAEREMLALHNTIFMQSKLGEEFDGIISHVTKFGFFVELLDYFVEGLVPLQNLSGDFYVYDQDHLCLRGKKRKKIFKIGDRVRIKVEEVKLLERRTYFNLLDIAREA